VDLKKNVLSTAGAKDILTPRRTMDANTFLKDVWWLAPQPLIAFLATRMVRNRFVAEVPVFFAYLWFSVAKSLVRFAVYHWMGGGSVEYFRTYWIFALVDAVFVLAVIRELYIVVLSPYEGLKMLASALFRWALAIMILIAALDASSKVGPDLTRFATGVLTLDGCATVVQMGLIILLFLACSSLSLPWHRHLFGIATGLAIVITIDVVSLAITLRYGQMFATTYNWVKSIAYLCCVIVWSVYLLRREARALIIVASDDLRLQEWNTALLKLLHRQG
jgi:hypothetical protein